MYLRIQDLLIVEERTLKEEREELVAKRGNHIFM